VTIGFSSYREIKLLWNDKPTIETALKNVAVDGMSVGAGTFAGAKAGTLAGACFGPHGAAVGAVIGSIVGAIGGKQMAAALRFSPFTSKGRVFENRDTAHKHQSQDRTGAQRSPGSSAVLSNTRPLPC